MNGRILPQVPVMMVVLCSLMLGGCIGGRYVTPPEIAMEESLVVPDRTITDEEKQVLTVKMTDEGEEVAVFTIEQAIDRSVRYNIRMLNMYEQYRMVESDLRGAKAEFLVKYSPTITGIVAGEDDAEDRFYSVNVTKKHRLGTVGGIRVSAESGDDEKKSAIRFSLDQPLLRGAGKLVVTNNLVNARRNIAITLRAIEMAKEQLVFSVVSNYYEIIREKELVSLYEKSAERMRTLLEQSRQKQKVDLVSEADVLRVEIQLAWAEDNLITARQFLGDALDDLKILLGYSEVVQIDIDAGILYEEVEVDEDEAMVTALTRRIDYLEARDRIRDAERNQKVARNNLLPDLDLVVGYAFSGEGTDYSEAFKYEDSSWFLGFSTTTDVRRVAERAGYARARLETQNVRRDFILLRDQILREVRQNIRNLNKNLKRIQLQRRTVEHAENQFKLAQLRYSQNLITDISIVTDAEDDLILAQTNYILAVTDYIVSQARLKMALGTLTEKSPEVYAIGYFAN